VRLSCRPHEGGEAGDGVFGDGKVVDPDFLVKRRSKNQRYLINRGKSRALL